MSGALIQRLFGDLQRDRGAFLEYFLGFGAFALFPGTCGEPGKNFGVPRDAGKEHLLQLIDVPLFFFEFRFGRGVSFDIAIVVDADDHAHQRRSETRSQRRCTAATRRSGCATEFA